MLARDVMTAEVVAVAPDTSVKEIAALLSRRRISAVPVVDAAGRVIGIVSEGDLLHRGELGTERRRSWWLEAIASNRDLAAEFVKAHGRRARDVMTKEVVSVSDETPLVDVALLLEAYGIKRVPVLCGGSLVGILSRADLVRALATAREPDLPAARSDQAIREALLGKLRAHRWFETGPDNFTVRDGVVHLWGPCGSEEERQALRVAAETVKGVRRVEQHMAPLAAAPPL